MTPVVTPPSRGPAGFDADVVPAVQLQAAAADHHVPAEQGQGLRGGRHAAGVQEGRRQDRQGEAVVAKFYNGAEILRT